MTETNQPAAKQALKNWMEKNNVSYKELSAKLDYAYNHLYQVVNGSSNVTWELVGRFLHAYGADAAGRLAEALMTTPEPEQSTFVSPSLNL